MRHNEQAQMGPKLYRPPRQQIFAAKFVQAPRRLDISIAALIAVLIIVVSVIRKCGPLTAISLSDRHELYQLSLTISATLAGFILTSVSVLVNLLKAPLSNLDRIVDVSDKRQIGLSFIDCIPAISLFFAASLLCFGFDAVSSTNTLQAAVETLWLAAGALSALRLVRIVLILRLLLPVSS